ncbi:hypothetical protein GJAV_G00213990 [Gymnothorax javanicus]|nr:hypothetical protein GJAV_G00213990 [Gymnothorax javanicus]
MIITTTSSIGLKLFGGGRVTFAGLTEGLREETQVVMFALHENGLPAKRTAPSNVSVQDSSLGWCLAQLSRPLTDGGGEADRRAQAGLWRALVAVRTRHIKGGSAGIARYRARGGLRPLLELLRRPGCHRKTLDLVLSILANCCTEGESRTEVQKLGGIVHIVAALKNVPVESVQNRAARALGNLAIDPENSALIHNAGGAAPLILCLLECAQSAARALQYLSDTPSHRLSLLSQGALPALVALLAPEYPCGVRRASLRALSELCRGCSPECAREVARSGLLAPLGLLCSDPSPRALAETALRTLANLCAQGSLRPLVGSLGVIPKFVQEVKRSGARSGVFFRALCLCCKEAVNRAKVKESGGMELLIGFLSANQSHPLSRLAVLAFVDFIYDESAMEQLQGLGLAQLLVARLVDLAEGQEADGELDTTISSSLMEISCFESFDFPQPEGQRREEGAKEQNQGSSSFLSLRSWLLSEGLISCEGELVSPAGGAEGNWSSLCASLSPSAPLCDGGLSAVTCTSPSLAAPLQSSTPDRTHLSPPHKRSATSASTPPVKRPPSCLLPEPWTSDCPILLLLSRFSQSPDPSASLIYSGVLPGLFHYLTRREDPSARCFRTLSRLSCNPNCLQGLVRTGVAAFTRLRLCHREGLMEGHKQTARVQASTRRLGEALLSNMRVQCESSFGSGVLSHIMLSGSDVDRLYCVFSLPLLSSNKILLRKLLLDNRGLQSALDLFGWPEDSEGPSGGFWKSLAGWLLPLQPCSPGRLRALYCSLLVQSLSRLLGRPERELERPLCCRGLGPCDTSEAVISGGHQAPPSKRPHLAQLCPYLDSQFDVVFLLDDGSRFGASEDAVSGGAGSDYFRALLKGAFGEAQRRGEEAIRIRDVSANMLLPVLHFLHGCCVFPTDGTGVAGLWERRQGAGVDRMGGGCVVLGSLVVEGLGGWGMRGAGEMSLEGEGLPGGPLAEAMAGASRFLVSGLQEELETLCIAFLQSHNPQRPITATSATRQSPEEEERQLVFKPGEAAFVGQSRQLPLCERGSRKDASSGLDADLEGPAADSGAPLGPKASLRGQGQGQVCSGTPSHVAARRESRTPHSLNLACRVQHGVRSPCDSSDLLLESKTAGLSEPSQSAKIRSGFRKRVRSGSPTRLKCQLQFSRKDEGMANPGADYETSSDSELPPVAPIMERAAKLSGDQDTGLRLGSGASMHVSPSAASATNSVGVIKPKSISGSRSQLESTNISGRKLDSSCFGSSDPVPGVIVEDRMRSLSQTRTLGLESGLGSSRTPVPHDQTQVFPQPACPADPSLLCDAVCEKLSFAALLPDMYHFSQIHNYPRLRGECLSALLWQQRSLWAADCLADLALRSHCIQTLRKDLLLLVCAALS